MSVAGTNSEFRTEWIYPFALVSGFLALAAMLPPAILRDGMLAVCLLVVFLAVIAQLVAARRCTAAESRSRKDIVFPAVVSLGLSTLFWYRAAIGVSGWDGIGFGIVITLGWWLPAAAFAALYRYPGERWLEQGRGRFFLRLVVVGVFASLPALPIQSMLHEQRAVRAEIAGLPGAVESLAERVLPRGAGIEYRLDNGVLHLDVTWPVLTETGHYRQITMLHSLAGDAGALRPGGADRLVERVNVDRVRLQVFRGERLIADMDWPRQGLRRGEQALFIDHDAAGLVSFPTQAILDELLRGVPERYQTGYLCARGMDGEIWIERCEGDPGSVADEDVPELKQELGRDWQAINLLVREITRVFPDVSAFQVTLAGHEVSVPRAAVSPAFDARTFDARMK